MLSESFKVKFFDIRKPDKEVYGLPHFCEEAPPTILQLVPDNTPKSDLLKNDRKYSILLANNPYPNGSPLITKINQKTIIKADTSQ